MHKLMAGYHQFDAVELERSDSQAHFQTHSRSKTVAKPCPTPTQSDAMPREAPVRAIWWISVVARRAPLQPSGGPIAIAPTQGVQFCVFDSVQSAKSVG